MLILIPVVDKANFMAAVRHVIREFMSGERMDVHLLHVSSPFFLSAAAYLKGKKPDALHRETAAKTLQPARALLERFHIPHTVHLESGDRARAIDAVARRLKVDRIVLGTARPWSATRLAEDAVVQKVLDRAPAPVSVVAGKSVSRLERYGVAAGLGATLWLILFG